MEQHIKCIAVTNQAEEKHHFALQELLALLDLFGLKYSFDQIHHEDNWQYQPSTFKYYPFIVIYLPNTEVFEELLSRAVYVNQLMVFLSEGSSLEELAEKVVENPYIKDGELTARIEFLTSYGKWFEQKEKVGMIDAFTDMVEMKNKVDLKNAGVTYYICAYETYHKPGKKGE